VAQSHPVENSSMASAVYAVEANLFSLFQHLRTWRRIEVREDDRCVWTISDLPFPLFNSVMRARVDDDRVGSLIETRQQACRERRVPMLWWTGPSSLPADLGRRLETAGFFIDPAFGMTADLNSVGTTDAGPSGSGQMATEPVSDRATLMTWSRVLCEGFGAPQAFGAAFAEMAEAVGIDRDARFRHYLARFDGQPAATCSVFFGAGVAGIYDVSTLPSLRRRGIGRAITRHAMDQAVAAGYRVAILHASQLGVAMYRSLGFETVCDIGQYVWAPEG
jgi:GNAT superfamily N-acetyltransferase